MPPLGLAPCGDNQLKIGSVFQEMMAILQLNCAAFWMAPFVAQNDNDRLGKASQPRFEAQSPRWW